MTATAVFPPSFAQELLWLAQRASPESDAYNVPRTRLLLGTLDVEALRRAFETVVERHEVLRTTYDFDGEQPLQRVHPPRRFELARTDLRSLPPAERRPEAQRLARAAASRPFDLARDFPLRAALFRTGDDEWVLQVDSHHIAADGGSRDILFRELDVAYAAACAGRRPELVPLPLQFADYAVWERRYFSGERLERSLTYWRAQLGEFDSRLDLVPDVSRDADVGEDAVTRSVLIPAERLEPIRSFATDCGATLYMALLAAYAVALHPYAPDGGDVLVGAPISGRSRPGLDELIGCFVNTTVQRVRFDGDPSFATLLRRVRESVLGAYDHQELPLEKLLLESNRGRSAGAAPLVQAVFTMLDPGEGGDGRFGDVFVRPLATGAATTKFDVTLFQAERSEGLHLSLRVRANLWRAQTVERFLARLVHLLEAAVRNPSMPVSRLPLIGESERAQLARWNATSVEFDLPPGADATSQPTFVAFFDAARARFPTQPAVIVGERELSYERLAERADRLARRLREHGAAAGHCVGILCERSPASIVALVGVAKSGASFAFLSPELPPARLAQQIGESDMRLVVTSASHARLLPPASSVLVDDEGAILGDGGSTDDSGFRNGGASINAGVRQVAGGPVHVCGRNHGPQPDDLAYVVYTSGSTGVPKGVAVTHANLANYVRAISRVLADVPADTTGDGMAALAGWHFAMASSLATDLGNTSLFTALCTGGTLHLLPAETTNDATNFADYLRARPLDVLKITPSHLRALLCDETKAAALPERWLVCGGEALDLELASALLQAGRPRVLNHYGPTETTVGATTFEVTAASFAAAREAGAKTIPIGAPLANVSAHVLGVEGQPVPVGVPGELYLSGAGVAAGYLNRPDFTAQRFVVLEDIGRAYRTGDRVRFLENGALEFLGRTDAQVKVHGYRIELGAIEAALRALPEVRDAVVVPFGDPTVELAAYVVPEAHGTRTTSSPFGDLVRDRLASVLPAYMLPLAIVSVDAFPLTPTGKLDRRALPPQKPPLREQTTGARPHTDIETTLLSMWAEIFKRDPSSMSVDDDFLSLGGHSLLAIRLLGKISRQFGVRLPLNVLFERPTIAELASHIVSVRSAAPASQAPEPTRIPRAAFRNKSAQPVSGHGA